MAFDNITRNRLQRLVGACRKVLTEEFDAQLQERYGIFAAEGRIFPLEKVPYLDDGQNRIANLLRERIEHIIAAERRSSDRTSEAIWRVLRELANLTFEPEKTFETLVKYEDEEGGALISGSIDIVRRDNPPQVTLIDFKSGDPESDKHRMLTEHEMKLQVALYAVAAKKELEYQPEQGLVRYLDAADEEKSEMQVPLDSRSIEEARSLVAGTAARIRDRKFYEGPKPNQQNVPRCKDCDFLCMCGLGPAMNTKQAWR